MGSELMYGMSWYDSQPKVTTRKTFFFSIFNCFVLGSKQHFYDHVSFFMHARPSNIYTYAYGTFFGWTKRNVLFTSVFRCLHVRHSFFFAYDNKIRLPKHLFQRKQPQKGTYDIKMMLILRYAKKKHSEMR